ncbi:hypothetical protein [Streptomyces erythrochromogenes]
MRSYLTFSISGCVLPRVGPTALARLVATVADAAELTVLPVTA